MRHTGAPPYIRKGIMPNKSLFREIENAIMKDEDSLDMSTWGTKTECGTTLCVAGWAVVLSCPPENLVWTRFQDRDGTPSETQLDGVYIPDAYGVLMHKSIGNAAKTLLGLDSEEGSELFTVSNENAIAKVKAYANGEDGQDVWA